MFVHVACSPVCWYIIPIDTCSYFSCQHDNGYMDGRSQIKVHTVDRVGFAGGSGGLTPSSLIDLLSSFAWLTYGGR